MDLINKFQALTPGMKLTIVLVSIFSLILVYCMFNRNNLLNTQEEKEVNVFSENFNSNTSNAVFTMYYADWCPHCQAAKPEFKKMMKYNNKKFGNKTLELVMVDCEKNPELAEKEGVEGYPTFIYKEGDKKEVYSGERNEMGFIEYLKEKIGSIFG
jgi:thiol-disulfide isomerase/thioredoxin